MSCGELFVNLGGGGSTPPNGMLQTTAALSSSLQVVKDNLGNSSALQVATEKVAFGVFTGATTGNIIWSANGTLTEYTGWHQSDGDYKLITKNASPIFINISNGLNFANGFSTQGGFNSSGFYVGSSATQNGAATIKGSGGNILSLRNSSNVEVGSIDNSGNYTFTSNGSSIYDGFSNQIFSFFYNQVQLRSRFSSGGGYFDGLIPFGGYNSASFPALKRSSAILQTKLADDSAFAVHEVLSILTQKPTNSNAQKIKFGDKSPITDGALVALGFDVQWEVEINATSYWFAGKTSAFA
jgi:hypothetical protein